MSVFKNILATTLLFTLAACGPSGDSVEGSAPALQDIGSPTDNFGVYTGTVGGEPGFMVIYETPGEMPTVVVSILQRGGASNAFAGAGLAAREPQFNFESGWPGGGGQLHEQGRLSGPNRGQAIIVGTWSINERISGSVRRTQSQETLLDFDLEFDPITLSTAPEGNSIPAGSYDIVYDERDIGDFIVDTPGAGTGSVTWPGADTCAIVASTGLRAPGTTRNVWLIDFNTDLNCTTPSWGVGYAMTNGRSLSFELRVSRRLSMAPAPEGQQDLVHVQLRRRG